MNQPETPIRAILVDDEPAARETLSVYLNKYCSGIEVVAEAGDVPSAVETILKFKPELVFLDVEMPFGNAFDVLEQTAPIRYQTIFVTAYSDYAIKAFNFSAAYYILKPVDISELIRAVEKVKQHRSDQDGPDISRILSENLKNSGPSRLVIPTTTGFEVIMVKQIIRLEGSSNYTEIYLNDGKKKVVSKLLKYFDELLSGNGFMRVHKSHIVQIEQIQSYHKGRGGLLIMSDKSEVEVSPSKKDELLAHFSQG